MHLQPRLQVWGATPRAIRQPPTTCCAVRSVPRASRPRTRGRRPTLNRRGLTRLRQPLQPCAPHRLPNRRTSPHARQYLRARRRKKLREEYPEYSNVLRAWRVGGIVEVRLSVDQNGRVTSAQAVSGPAPLRKAAEQAVQDWRYQPATIDGAPAAAEITVTFNFDPKADRRQD